MKISYDELQVATAALLFYLTYQASPGTSLANRATALYTRLETRLALQHALRTKGQEFQTKLDEADKLSAEMAEIENQIKQMEQE